MWEMTSQSRPLLVLTCLVLVTSADHVTWQPSRWLNEFEQSSSGGLKVLMVTDTNETMTKILHNEQLNSCELRVNKIQLELENTKLKQQLSKKNNELEIHKLKLKHSEETNTLTEEKIAALQETLRYKRELQDFNAALARLKSELREEFSHLKFVNVEDNTEKSIDFEIKEEKNSSFKESIQLNMELLSQNFTNLNNKLNDFESKISKIQNQNDILNVIFNLTSGNCDDVRNIKLEILQLKDSVSNISDHQTKHEELQDNFIEKSHKEIMKNITHLLSLQTSLETQMLAENCSNKIISVEKKIQNNIEEILSETKIIIQNLNVVNATTLINAKQIEGLEVKMSYLDNIYVKEKKYNITGLYELYLYELHDKEAKKEEEVLGAEINATKERLQNKIQQIQNYKTQLSSEQQQYQIAINGSAISIVKLHENALELKNQFDLNVTSYAEGRQNIHLTQRQETLLIMRANLLHFSTQIKNLEENVDSIKNKMQKIVELEMIQLGDHFYHFSKNKLSWYDAQKFCRSHGFELAALETEKENTLVVTQWKIKYSGSPDTWVDGTDEGSEGNWRWSHSGRAFNFTNWHPGQPEGGTKENCMCLATSSNQNWADWICKFVTYYICEGTN